MPEQLPIWNAVGTEPTIDLQTNGWQPGMKPSAQHMNWLFNRSYKVLEELQSTKVDKVTGKQLSTEDYTTIDKSRVTSIEVRQIENIGYGVQAGLEVTASATPDMNVTVQSGIVYMPDGQRLSFDVVTTIAVTVADATNPRKDIIIISSDGVISHLAGLPSATPTEPILPAGALGLCVIDVPANDTAIEQSQITDTRIFNNNLTQVKQELTEHLAESKKWIRVTKASNQSIASGASSTAVTFDNIENFNDATFAVLDGTTKAIKVNEAGIYEIVARIYFGGNATGERSLALDNYAIRIPSIGTSGLLLSGSTFTQLSAGAVVACQVSQTSGGALDVLSSVTQLLIRKVVAV